MSDQVQDRTEQDEQQYPRVSEEEVHEVAERAKAKFGGTTREGKGAESPADNEIARGEKPGPFEDRSSWSGKEPHSASQSDDEGPVTTGQKFASILGSDPNMQWESKIADKLSGSGDDSGDDAQEEDSQDESTG